MKDSFGTSSRVSACRGCDASMSNDEITKLSMAAMSTESKRTMLDKLWHEKYRPMAEFAGLVEEAQCQQ